jgi:hypothetical protein
LQLYLESVEFGRIRQTSAGREAGAKAAFGLALMLREAEDVEGAIHASPVHYPPDRR